ncbi:MAG: signal peptidase I [Candidatus Acidiferrales bacterium]
MSDEALPSIAPEPSSSSRNVPSGEGPLRGYVESLIVTIALALFATTFLAQAFKIPSASMVPALLVGDHLLVNKFVYGGAGKWYERFLPYRPVRRGDVIVFKYPYEDHPYYVKRVIALPGDRIHIANQRVYLNGSPLKEPYAVHNPSTADPYMFDFPPGDPFIISGEITPEWAHTLRQDTHNGDLRVPPNQYFVLGDNRDNSSDSRYWGFVPRAAIVGRPLFVYWSLKNPPAENGASSIAQQFANLGKTLLDIPFRTRWNRIFHQVR